MIKVIVIFTLLTTSTSSCLGNDDIQSPTLSMFGHKHNDEIKYVPYVAQVLYKGKYICGGCIRSEEWIITAAHCFDDKQNTSDFEILTGTNYRQGSNGERHMVDKIILHYNYSPKDVNAENDIALVQLSKPMRFSNVQQSIRVLPLFYNIKFVKVTGFGLDDKTLDLAVVVNSMTVPVISHDDCKNYYGGGINNNMFCAGTNEDYFCEGDSGNPVVDELNRLVGIVSRGKDCALGSAPSIHTKVSHYISWIDEKTKIPSQFQ